MGLQEIGGGVRTLSYPEVQTSTCRRKYKSPDDLPKETERLEEKLDTHDNRWTTRTPISTPRCRRGHPQKPNSVRSDRTCRREVDSLVRCTVKVSLSHVTTPSLSVVWLGTPCTGEGCNISSEIYLVLFRQIRVILYDLSLLPSFFVLVVAYNSN